MTHQPIIIGKLVVVPHPHTSVKETYSVIDKITTDSGATAYLVQLIGTSQVKIISPGDIRAIHKD
jgi:hypothetical protein